MSPWEYRFVTRWRARAPVSVVCGILADPLGLPRWWPQVYLSARALDGGVYELHTRGRLPYTLRWRFRTIDVFLPRGFSLLAWGDLEGSGTWRFEEANAETRITYEWNVRVRKPLLRWLSPAMKPVFAANHRWAMASGERALNVELARYLRVARPVLPAALPHY